MGSFLTRREFVPWKNSFRVEEVGNESQREFILVGRRHEAEPENFCQNIEISETSEFAHQTTSKSFVLPEGPPKDTVEGECFAPHHAPENLSSKNRQNAKRFKSRQGS